MYCPWDVINYCYDLRADKNKKPQAYWINTSGNDMVRHLIDKVDDGTSQIEIERLIEGQSIRKTLNDKLTHSEIYTDINNLWSLLFMTGYLTMKGAPIDDTYELVIPNNVVRKIYIEKVRKWFVDRVKSETGRLTELHRAFEEGDLLALLNTCAEWNVTSNRETGKGRSDISVERKDRKRGFVVEVKDVKEKRSIEKACADAIAQIEEKDYTATMRLYRIKDIWIYGINGTSSAAI